MSTRGAVELALDLYRHPTKVKAARKSPLPEDVLKVIRIAAGSDEELTALDVPDAKSPAELRDAAAFFMQQVLFQKGNDNYRMLGLNHNASMQLIKDHKRLLLKWLHPDRNQNTWEQVYFHRVLVAAEKLEDNSGTALVLVEPHNNSRSRHRSHAEKIQLRMKPVLRKQVDWRMRLRLWFKRSVIFSALVLISLTGFSIINRMGYFSDDLPLLDRLQAWLR